jgi:hypothetical protein
MVAGLRKMLVTANIDEDDNFKPGEGHAHQAFRICA